MSEGRLAPVALKLAGLAGWHLGWSADRFWGATPAEMEAVIATMLEQAGVGRDGGRIAPSPAEMAKLQEIFPDG